MLGAGVVNARSARNCNIDAEIDVRIDAKIAADETRGSRLIAWARVERGHAIAAS